MNAALKSLPSVISVQARWNAVAQKLSGTTEEIRSINACFKTLEQKIYEAYQQLSTDGGVVSAESLKDKLTGKEHLSHSLIAIFEDHNRQVKALVGQEYAAGTLDRYRTSLKHTVDFLQWKYGKNDIDIKDISHEFITSYEFYLRSVRKCNNNSTVKYIRTFKKIIRICLANGWIIKRE